MLHGRNIYGDGLKDPLKDRGMCQECGVICTEKHLLIECPIAEALWDLRGKLWKRMGAARGSNCQRPKTVNELKLMVCKPRMKSSHDRSRHLILTSLVVWVLWKAGTKQWYEGVTMCEQSVCFLYKQLVLEQIQVDRIECETLRYAGKKKELDARFKGIWGFPRSELTIGGTPKCLRAL